MNNNSCRRRRSRTSDRRGLTIIAVIAFYAIAMAMIGVWVQSAIDRHQQSRQWHEKAQSIWLADAGIRRAVAHLTRQPGYEGEVWQIDAEQLGGLESATVAIEVEAAETDEQFTVTATAVYPAGSKKRVQHTKSVQYRVPDANEPSGESS